MLSARSPARRRSRGSARYWGPGPGGPTSNWGWALSTGYCQTIQSERGPVSPSGTRRSRSPSPAASGPNTSSGLASGPVPNRCTPLGLTADGLPWAGAVRALVVIVGSLLRGLGRGLQIRLDVRAELVDPVGLLPRRVDVRPAEVAVRGGGGEDRPAQVEL